MNAEKLQKYAPGVVRLGVGLVFFVFGIWQYVDPTSWYGYLPASIPFGLSSHTAILLNGTFDLLLGILLIAGLFTRITALIASLHLIGIVLIMGWNDVAMRDLGHAIVLIGIALRGPDLFCADKKLHWKLNK